MEEVWDKLHQATSDDALIEFLQRLLTLDPAARADFAALANHPYVQMEPALLPASNAPRLGAPSPAMAALMPSSSELCKAVRTIPGLQGDTADALQAVPGVLYLMWDPDSLVCVTASGAVYRQAQHQVHKIKVYRHCRYHCCALSRQAHASHKHHVCKSSLIH